jgi:hypothetical protein
MGRTYWFSHASVAGGGLPRGASRVCRSSSEYVSWS